MNFLKINLFVYLPTIFFFLFSTVGYSQKNLDDNNFVAVNEDLTQRAITSIFKDNENYLWIGTYGDGIFRYNSNDFKNYKQEWNTKRKSLNGFIVFSMLQDKQNSIWAGTEFGINRYNSNLDQFENIKLTKNGTLATFAIHAIAEYDEKTLLLGTHQNGLLKFNKKNYSYKKIPFKKNNSVTDLLINAIVKSPNGQFFIGTNFGLMTFDPKSQVLQLAKFKTQNGYEDIDASVESLYITKDKSVWIGTFSSGLIRLVKNKNNLYSIEKLPITNKRILSLAEKSNSRLLCGTENDGLFDVNYVLGTVKNYRLDKSKQNGIKSNSIWAVYTDQQNRIWLGYYNNGIDVYDDNYNKFDAIKCHPFQTNSLNSNSVTGIIKDDKNRLWLSIEDGGVDVYDTANKAFVHLSNQNNSIAQGLNSANCTTIFIDRKKNIWVGTWDMGLFLLKHNQKKFININTQNSGGVFTSNRIMSFDEDSKGTIWIGTYLGGLYSYNTSSENFTHHDSPEFKKHNINTSSIRKVLVDQNDNIWLGSITGLYKVKMSGSNAFSVSTLNKKMNFGLGQQIPASIIVSLYEDKNKHLWIGTFGNGLCRYNSNKDTLEWYTIKNGLLHETVSSIIQDASGNIWIGGNVGLSKLNSKENTFINYNKKDGLLSNNFNFNSVYKSSTNELYFGNSKGVNYFNPDKIIYNNKKPTVYFTDLKLANEFVYPNDKDSPLNKALSKTTNLVLDHDQSVFTIGYIGINYTRSENNKYAYYLDGYEDKWNYVENIRSATYKNIPPGVYTFKVKASNNDGLWNEVPATLEIKVKSAWWATKLAILCYLLLTIFISYIIYRFIKQRVEERRILHFERQEHTQFELLNAKKIEFFTNISHEFRTPLTLILTPLEDIIEQENTQFSPEIKEKLNIMYRNTKRLSRLINELMDFRKLQSNKMSMNAAQINLIPFVEEVVSHYEEESRLKNIALTIKFEKSDLAIWFDPSMLEKIIFNLLSNAFKATPEGGLISIEINNCAGAVLLPLVDENKAVEAIEIIITDTGFGISEENIDKVFDRFFQANDINEQYYSGTGIGLELVKSLVELHKGKIVLTSTVNVGTTFKIYFPLGYAHLKEENINRENANSINQYSETTSTDSDEIIDDIEHKSKKTVLIVEDNLELRTYLKNELKNEYFVKEADNGQDGLEKAIKFIPDVIITDVMMPIMDGFTLCEFLKNDVRTSYIPLLMITAKGMQIDTIKGIDSGADVYLNKPFNIKVLKSHLKQLINSRQILFEKYFNGANNAISADNITSLDKEFMYTVVTYINDNLSDENLNVENLAEKLLLSRSKLYRKIKTLTGHTANEFIRKIRLDKSKNLIDYSDYTISEISYMVGFSSPSYFTKCFKDYFDVLPTEIRNKKEEDINPEL